jgi:hypothetical protein
MPETLSVLQNPFKVEAEQGFRCFGYFEVKPDKRSPTLTPLLVASSRDLKTL